VVYRVNGVLDPVKADPLSGGGWGALTASGGGTVTWNAAPPRLTCDIPLGVAGSCGVEQSGFLVSPEWYELLCRVQVTQGDGSSVTRYILAAGQSATDCVSVALWTNSNVEPGYVVGGSFTSLAIVAGPGSGQRTGGHLWMRITRTPVALAFSWGEDLTATGAVPTVWTTVNVTSSAAALAASGGRYVALVHMTLSSLHFATDTLALRASPASPGPL
jgi:hypothetical protein